MRFVKVTQYPERESIWLVPEHVVVIRDACLDEQCTAVGTLVNMTNPRLLFLVYEGPEEVMGLLNEG